MTPQPFRWYGVLVNGWPVRLCVADITHVVPAGTVLAMVVPRRIAALTQAERRAS